MAPSSRHAEQRRRARLRRARRAVLPLRRPHPQRAATSSCTSTARSPAKCTCSTPARPDGRAPRRRARVDKASSTRSTTRAIASSCCTTTARSTSSWPRRRRRRRAGQLAAADPAPRRHAPHGHRRVRGAHRRAPAAQRAHRPSRAAQRRRRRTRSNSTSRCSASSPGANLEYDTTTFRLGYESFVTPPSVYDYDLDEPSSSSCASGSPCSAAIDPRTTTQTRGVGDGRRRHPGADLGGAPRRRRRTTARRRACCTATARTRRAWTRGSRPSACRCSTAASCSPSPTSAAEARCGRQWYEDGKLLRSATRSPTSSRAPNTCAPRATPSPDRLAARGGSAGGLLMGAVANLAPQQFAAVVAEVPFVDALNTILDPSLPLTVIEWEEWGNPIESADVYAYMKSYSPYENVEARDYPAILATAGLNDPRVGYHEPAKWVAKLRATKTDDAPFAAEDGDGRRPRRAVRALRPLARSGVRDGLRHRSDRGAASSGVTASSVSTAQIDRCELVPQDRIADHVEDLVADQLVTLEQRVAQRGVDGLMPLQQHGGVAPSPPRGSLLPRPDSARRRAPCVTMSVVPSDRAASHPCPATRPSSPPSWWLPRGRLTGRCRSRRTRALRRPCHRRRSRMSDSSSDCVFVKRSSSSAWPSTPSAPRRLMMDSTSRRRNGDGRSSSRPHRNASVA